MTHSFRLALALLLATVAAVVVALWPVSAAFADGHYLPVGPDGFYHARRILDTVADTSAFFQFDPYTHVPEGHLVTWPWFYDYAVAVLVRLALALHLTNDPMTALAHVPVLLFAFVPVLTLSICRSLGLPAGLTLLAMLCAAFFPLNQAIFSIGSIDHHGTEHLFVLGALASALGWLKHPDSSGRAIVCGLTLGLACGVHSALFALQLPLLGTFALLWLRGQALPRHTPTFAVALVAAQTAVALPSLPLREGHFDYTTLSLFQPYVALCTATVTVLLARLPRSGRGFAILAGVALVLLVPTVRQVLSAREFFAGEIGAMQDILEVQSVWAWTRMTSLTFVAENYTWLVVLVPAAMALCAWWLWKPRDAVHAHFALASLFGLVLLLTQTRLSYFGSFALWLPWLVLLARLRGAPAPRLAATAVAALVVVAAYLPGMKTRVFIKHPLAEEPNYAVTHDIYGPMAARCERAPGVVLAHPFEGHYIRFHSRCSVIANPFLLTRQDVEKYREAERLLELPAAGLAAAAPDVRYVLARSATIFVRRPDGSQVFAPGDYEEVHEYRLVRELLAADANALPPGFELVYELSQGPGMRPFTRLFAVHANPRAIPAAASPPPATSGYLAAAKRSPPGIP